MTTGNEFLAAVRGIPAHHVTKALSSMTPGIDWQRCSKTLMAESFDKKTYSNRMLLVDLDVLVARAKARAAGDPLWSHIGKTGYERKRKFNDAGMWEVKP